jgi:hypothetical protein
MLSYWSFQTGLAPIKGKINTLPELDWSGIQWKDLPKGCIIAVVRIVDCVPTGDMTQKQIEIERYFGDYAPGRYAWILDDIQPLPEPIPAKGKQGLWEWKEDKSLETNN